MHIMSIKTHIRPVFWAIEAAILQICISNVSFLYRTTLNNFRNVKVFNSTNGRRCVRAVLYKKLTFEMHVCYITTSIAQKTGLICVE